jgi:hypothetical protein
MELVMDIVSFETTQLWYSLISRHHEYLYKHGSHANFRDGSVLTPLKVLKFFSYSNRSKKLAELLMKCCCV